MASPSFVLILAPVLKESSLTLKPTDVAADPILTDIFIHVIVTFLPVNKVNCI